MVTKTGNVQNKEMRKTWRGVKFFPWGRKRHLNRRILSAIRYHPGVRWEVWDISGVSFRRRFSWNRFLGKGERGRQLLGKAFQRLPIKDSAENPAIGTG